VVEEVDEDLELEKTERGQIVRERRIFLKEYDQFVEEQRWGSFMIITGITLFVVGSWTLMVPLYKLVCERYGFSPKTHKTDYNVETNSHDTLRKWRVHFNGAVEDDLPWNFEAESKLMQVGAGETALAFFKAYNSSDKPIVGLSVYQVDPNEASLYFNKVQCF
jgi:cytochrome c oxidase assembly protein subunit 11